jgi:hypothetical protein
MELLDANILGPLACEVCHRSVSYLVLFDETEGELEICEICLIEALRLFPGDESITV